MYIIDTKTGESILDNSYTSEWLAIPADLTLPAPLKKLAKEYETVWNVWSEEAATLETNAGEMGTAEAADTLALVTAVSKGEPNPGHPNRDQATENYRYQAEVVRQAAGRANGLRAKVIASMIEHRATLMADAANLEREAIARSRDSYTEARQIAERAENETLTIGSRINWIRATIDGPVNHYQLMEGWIPNVTWPETYKLDQPGALAALENIEENEAS